jgi:general secretion pathway protein J
MTSRRARGGGFTLIEVMIAIAILAMMLGLVWGTVARTGAARRRYGALTDRYRVARVALARMANDLSVAYLSRNEDLNLIDRRTYFKGDASGDVDTLTFSAFARKRLFADANESEQTVVSYYPASDPDDRRKTNVLRRELRRPGNEKFDQLPGEADILFPDVLKLEFQYWDFRNEEWRDDWDSTAVDGQDGRLPDRLKITLTFEDEKDHEVTLTSQVRIPLQEVITGHAD